MSSFPLARNENSLALDSLWVLQEEVADVARERETWSSLVEMLPPRLEDGWMEEMKIVDRLEEIK